MKKMKKVEFVIEAIYVNRLIDLLKDHGIHGYTIIKDIEGAGGHGVRTADDVSDMFSNNYVFTVCEDEKYQEMDKAIRNFLDRFGGKCMLSDVMLLLGRDKK